MNRMSIKKMSIEHVLDRDSGKHRIQPGGSLRKPLRQGSEAGFKAVRRWVISPSAPEGIAAALGTRKLLQLLKDSAAAHCPVQPPGAFAHRSQVSLRQHHPFSPVQHRDNIARTSTQLPSNGLPALSATVKTDVVLVEIGGAGNHDQRPWRLVGNTTSGRLHQSLHRPAGTTGQTLPLRLPSSRHAGQQSNDQSRIGP